MLDVQTQMWLLDIDGTRVAILLNSFPDTDPALVAEAEAVIESIVVEPAGDEAVRRLVFRLLDTGGTRANPRGRLDSAAADLTVAAGPRSCVASTSRSPSTSDASVIAAPSRQCWPVRAQRRVIVADADHAAAPGDVEGVGGHAGQRRPAGMPARAATAKVRRPACEEHELRVADVAADEDPFVATFVAERHALDGDRPRLLGPGRAESDRVACAQGWS